MKIGRLLARNAALNFLGQLIPLLIGIITIPFIIRRLGTDSFGVLSLVWAVLGYFTFFDLGLGLTTTKFISEALGKEDTASLPRLFWNTISIQAILAAFGAAALIAVTPFLVTQVFKIPAHLALETEKIFYLLALSLPFIMLTETASGVLQAAQRFELVNAVKMPASAAIFLLPALGVLAGVSLYNIVGIIVATRFAAFMSYLLLCFRVFPQLRRYSPLQGGHLKPLLSYGGWVTVSKILGPVLNYFERFFIVSLVSVGMLTFYSAPFEIVSRMIIIPASIAIAIFPAFSFYGKGSAVLEELFLRPFKYLLFAIMPVALFFFIFADKILGLWLGELFARESALLLRVLAAAFLVNAFAYVPLAAIQGLGRPDLKAKIDLALTPVFIGLLYFLVGTAGINGAAWAKLIVAIADTACLLWLAQRISGFSVGKLLADGLGRGLAISGGFALVASLSAIHESFILKLAFFCSSTVIYALLFWSFALDEKDRSPINNIYRSLLCKLNFA